MLNLTQNSIMQRDILLIYTRSFYVTNFDFTYYDSRKMVWDSSILKDFFYWSEQCDKDLLAKDQIFVQ